MGILSLFSNPPQAIIEAKKSKSMGMTMVVLLFSAVLIAILVAIITAMSTRSYSSWDYYSSYHSQVNAAAAIVGAFAAFMGVFLGTLFGGYLVSVVMKTLGGSGGFFEGLTSLAYSLYVPSVAIFIMGLLILGGAAAGGAGAIMVFVGMVVLIWGVVIGMATFYRSLKELFSTDMVTAIACSLIMSMPAMIVMMVLMQSLMMMPYMFRMY